MPIPLIPILIAGPLVAVSAKLIYNALKNSDSSGGSSSNAPDDSKSWEEQDVNIDHLKQRKTDLRKKHSGELISFLESRDVISRGQMGKRSIVRDIELHYDKKAERIYREVAMRKSVIEELLSICEEIDSNLEAIESKKDKAVLK
ncbi:MAG: hypothetical protein JJU11_18200 [Candidatus Sumerlaeia bacterium]|nr:hypothetical protein [Candidatus Sumerlaeia bacterium]